MKQRIITGAIFGIIVLFLVNFNLFTAGIFLTLIGLLCTWEYLLMIFHKSQKIKIYTYLLIEIIFAYIIIVDEGKTIPYIYLLYIALAYTLFSIVSLYLKKQLFYHHQTAMFHAAIYIVIPLVLLYKKLSEPSISSSEGLMTILCFIWLSDSAAYFVGSKFGKNKLFERISPGKTWEGSIGAGIAVLIIATIIFLVYPSYGFTYWILMAFTIFVFGTYGDLYESSIKRQYKVKDSGNLLPGHGGFLDRFDSFLFVIPVVLLIWIWIGI